MSFVILLHVNFPSRKLYKPQNDQAMYYSIAINRMFDVFSLNIFFSFTQSRFLTLNAFVYVKQEFTSDLKCLPFCSEFDYHIK